MIESELNKIIDGIDVFIAELDKKLLEEENQDPELLIRGRYKMG